MKIITAEFITSAISDDQYPRSPLPEVAFAGRSNVGKSSLINTLVHRKSLVKTSSTPGKTRTINFFVVNHDFLLVDLPGYGYAKVPRAIQASWRPMVETYLQQRTTLRAIVHLVDLRHPPTEMDQQLRAWLLRRDLTIITVATKADQVTHSRHVTHLHTIRQTLGLPPDDVLLPFSSHNHEGRLALWHSLMPFLTPVAHV